jgi:hypothetical protein
LIPNTGYSNGQLREVVGITCFVVGAISPFSLQKKRFEALQGFNDRYRVCEDLELIKRLYRQGAFTVLPQKIKTSSRRFHENGVARLLVHFGVLHLMHWWGVGPQSLSLYYRWAVR